MKRKKIISVLLTAVLLLSAMPVYSLAAEGEVAVNAENFPDEVFRNYVLEKIDKDQNGKSDSFTLKVKRIDDNLEGDVNMDGIVNINDATAIQMYLAGNSPENFNADAADINKDGGISISDATALQMILSGNN